MRELALVSLVGYHLNSNNNLSAKNSIQTQMMYNVEIILFLSNVQQKPCLRMFGNFMLNKLGVDDLKHFSIAPREVLPVSCI